MVVLFSQRPELQFKLSLRVEVKINFKYDKNKIPYYPVNTDTNNKLYERYEQEAVKEKNLILGGRLAQYKYLDMDQVMLAALETSRKFI